MFTDKEINILKAFCYTTLTIQQKPTYPSMNQDELLVELSNTLNEYMDLYPNSDILGDD